MDVTLDRDFTQADGVRLAIKRDQLGANRPLDGKEGFSGSRPASMP